MDLLEYQAKDLFREMGIPVLPSQRIDRPQDLKTLKIAYPIVLKSQVPVGGRGLAGGVRFAENTIDAIAAAQSIFNLPIMGEYPAALLAEAKYNADREIYLAVVLNRAIRRPVLLGSPSGGVKVQSAMDQMQQVVVEDEFSPFYARRLALKMGLQGPLINAVTAIIAQMYRLFVEADLDLVEINPLGVRSTGEVMALDGKVTANDDALARHPDLAALNANPTAVVANRLPQSLVVLDPKGTIGILCNGAGLTMATMDLVCQVGGKPIHFLNIGSETHYDSPPQALCSRLQAGLALIRQTEQVSAILINIVTGIVACDEVARAIAQSVLPPGTPLPQSGDAIVPPPTWHTKGSRRRSGQTPHLIVRLIGPGLEAAKEILATTPVTVVDRLDVAATETAHLAKPS
jgi:succinyl-CoA synthetase beta subunit